MGHEVVGSGAVDMAESVPQSDSTGNAQFDPTRVPSPACHTGSSSGSSNTRNQSRLRACWLSASSKARLRHLAARTVGYVSTHRRRPSLGCCEASERELLIRLEDR